MSDEQTVTTPEQPPAAEEQPEQTSPDQPPPQEAAPVVEVMPDQPKRSSRPSSPLTHSLGDKMDAAARQLGADPNLMRSKPAARRKRADGRPKQEPPAPPEVQPPTEQAAPFTNPEEWGQLLSGVLQQPAVESQLPPPVEAFPEGSIEEIPQEEPDFLAILGRELGGQFLGREEFARESANILRELNAVQERLSQLNFPPETRKSPESAVIRSSKGEQDSAQPTYHKEDPTMKQTAGAQVGPQQQEPDWQGLLASQLAQAAAQQADPNMLYLIQSLQQRVDKAEKLTQEQAMELQKRKEESFWHRSTEGLGVEMFRAGVIAIEVMLLAGLGYLVKVGIERFFFPADV